LRISHFLRIYALDPIKTEGFIIWSRGWLKGVYFQVWAGFKTEAVQYINLFGNRLFFANLWAGALLDGIFCVLAGFKMPFSRPNYKSLAFYVYAHLTPLKLKDLYSVSPSCDQIAKHPSGMRDFTQEQKGPSGMEDL
jgi:hypothetical protein